MVRYHYFVKQSQIPYRYMKKFQCIRLAEGDKRIPEFTKLYASSGWNVFIEHPYQPTHDLEVYRLKMYFYQPDAEFELTTPEDDKKQMR
jgi:hypothetical protein